MLRGSRWEFLGWTPVSVQLWVPPRQSRANSHFISKGSPDAWLYFYEDFLEVYDNTLRKQTGSYYTPPEVVGAMVGLVDEVLQSPQFGQHLGLASSVVTVADPATGTGTFLLGVLRRIADNVSKDQGPGAVKGAIQAALKRVIAFEMQLGPFAVAQLRILAEVVDLTGQPPAESPRMHVTDTLGNPYDDEGWIPTFAKAIGDSRKQANKIKREEPITVVLGNPPYKEKAKGKGGWVESGAKNSKEKAPLLAWIPPSEWGVGAHAKHLRNLYVYFWRWATWKVYDHGPGAHTGVVCFITVAGFLNGPGFEKMRDYLRRTCEDIWVIDCSPEGHQPPVNSRIFQGVQQPICIVLASRPSVQQATSATPASVKFRSLPAGSRETKFETLKGLSLSSEGWDECPTEWRAPFLPASTGAWAEFPKLEDLFVYNGSGVMPGRTWIIAPDVTSLENRWKALVEAPSAQKEELFHPHLVGGGLGDKHTHRKATVALHGYGVTAKTVDDETGGCLPPTPYGYRSFDRQWIIPDIRLINRPNPELWSVRSGKQIYLMALSRTSPTSGPAVTLTGLIPDLDYYNGRGGRAFPLWGDDHAVKDNFRPNLRGILSAQWGHPVSPNDLIAYVAGILASPSFTSKFQNDLSTPGLRVPITADWNTFEEVVSIGRRVIWLHTFGERMADPHDGRPIGPPRLPPDKRPHIPQGGAIPDSQEAMPDTLEYDAAKHRLHVGLGYIDKVTPAMWSYEVSGKQVLVQWFSYRKKNRERPLIGDRRKPSKLGDIQPDHWLPEYTTELINVLNVLGLLVELEANQVELLERVCSGPLITAAELEAAGAFDLPTKQKKTKKKGSGTPHMFETDNTAS